MKLNSLRYKLVLTSFLIEFIILSLLAFNSVRLIEHHLIEQSKQHLKEMKFSLNASLEGALIARDYATVQSMLDAFSSSSNMVYMVLKKEGKVVASSNYNAKFDKFLGSEALQRDTALFHTFVDITYFGQNYGKLYFAIDTSYLEVAKQELLMQSILISSVEIILSIILLLTMGMWLTKNLENLTLAVQNLSALNFDFTLNIKSKDEIGILSQAFLSMSEKIKNQFRTIQISNEKFKAIADFTYSWENWFDTSGKLKWINPAVKRVSGYDMSECYSMLDFPFCLVFPEDVSLVKEKHKLALEGQSGQDVEFRITCKDATIIWVAMSWQSIFDEDTKPLGYRSSIRDISLQHYVTEELQYQANHDYLTGLFSRYAFKNKLQQLVQDKQQSTLLYIDLDQFKIINDTCGHTEGDALLQELSIILKKRLGEDAYLARLGGDEFGIILYEDLGYAQRKAQKIIDIINHKTFVFDEKSFKVGASIGIVTIGDNPSLDANALLSAADSACNVAKEKGRNRIQVYSMDDLFLQDQMEQFSSVSMIHDALKNDKFILYSQKIEALNKKCKDHSEILIRLKNDDGTIISPNSFIPAAERFGLMLQIDKWVVETCCKNLALYGDSLPEYKKHININLSGSTIGSDNFVAFILETFQRYSTDASCIAFEITETSAISNIKSVVAFIETMRALNINIYLDDFGAGLSSFAYLRELNASHLKIDGLFVKDLVSNSKDTSVVQSMVELARLNQMKTVAEYVHDEAVYNEIKKLNVDFAQGYFIEEPAAWIV